MPRCCRRPPPRTPRTASSRIRAIATPAAPAPPITILAGRAQRLAHHPIAALRSAASATTAVPCWSSWNTGRSSRSCSRRSISKQRGAEMSSRLIPPKVGASRATSLDDLVHVGGVQADRDGVQIPAKCLNSIALPSITGSAARRADVAQPEHRGAVRDHGHGVAPAGVDVQQLPGPGGDRQADVGHPRGVGQGQVGAGRSAGSAQTTSSLPPSVQGEHRLQRVRHRQRRVQDQFLGGDRPRRTGRAVPTVVGAEAGLGCRRSRCSTVWAVPTVSVPTVSVTRRSRC